MQVQLLAHVGGGGAKGKTADWSENTTQLWHHQEEPTRSIMERDLIFTESSWGGKRPKIRRQHFPAALHITYIYSCPRSDFNFLFCNDRYSLKTAVRLWSSYHKLHPGWDLGCMTGLMFYNNIFIYTFIVVSLDLIVFKLSLSHCSFYLQSLTLMLYYFCTYCGFILWPYRLSTVCHICGSLCSCSIVFLTFCIYCLYSLNIF